MRRATASLPHGDQRKLEVALLMALEPSVYMFDEPTAGMSVDEVPVVLDLIRALKARKDIVVLLVEHGDEGALGLVLNRPSELPVAEVLPLPTGDDPTAPGAFAFAETAGQPRPGGWLVRRHATSK